MPYVIYGGVKYTQIRNAIFCKLCKETIESKSSHDFKMCSCMSVGIDGGTTGSRILGSPENIEQRSIYCAYVNGKKIWLPPLLA